MKAVAARFFDVVGSSGSTRILKIPFFQREYVWDEKNWEALRDDLLDQENDHFLGSVILKPEPQCVGTDVPVWNVIDGQQRLTTLSVLLKVCGDKLLEDANIEEKSRKFYSRKIEEALFVSTEDGDLIKLSHSRVDRGAYEEVLNGKSEHEKVSTVILDCWKWFKENIDLSQAKLIFDLLIGNASKEILVGITLNEAEHEQTIFDTINTAGVHLTVADTVKNYIFQKYLNIIRTEKSVLSDYNKYWEGVFTSDAESLKYWSSSKMQGRIKRTTLEVFLQCFAIVEGFFDPTKQNLSQLIDCYKGYVDNELGDGDKFKGFLERMAELADMYREFFVEFKGNAVLEWKDPCLRALHILRTCDASTFDPLVLKLYKDSRGHALPQGVELGAALDELSSYVLRHVVAGASVKNFNKECVTVIKGHKSIAEYRKEKIAEGEIDDESVKRGLLHIKKSYSKIARLVLLWMEIKRRMEEGDAQFKGVPVNYGSDIEHIMPQTWGEYWPVGKPVVVDPETGVVVVDIEQATKLRKDAVYEIGNMTLLTKGPNRRIKNREIAVKLNGDGAGIKGIEIDDIDIRYTRDVLRHIVENEYVWNEKTIRDRSKVLIEKFLSIW